MQVFLFYSYISLTVLASAYVPGALPSPPSIGHTQPAVPTSLAPFNFHRVAPFRQISQISYLARGSETSLAYNTAAIAKNAKPAPMGFAIPAPPVKV